MRIAHFILAHNNPQQLTKLVNRLNYAQDEIFIHLDKKADMVSFAHLKAYKNVYFIHKRVNVKWGAYSIVAATLNGFEQILGNGNQYDFINLLSGADYPLQSPEAIHAFLSNNTGKIYMSYKPIFGEWHDAVTRITNYHFNEYVFPGRYQMQRLINRSMPKRKMPNGLVAVGCSQWFTASTESIAYIINYWKSHANFRRFIKFTWAPDEFVFQTILYNSPYREQMENNNLRYIDWSGNAANPKTFTIDDADMLLKSDMLYARKFDLAAHGNVMAAIDDKLDRLEDTSAAQLVSA